jgi:hypothetical protein
LGAGAGSVGWRLAAGQIWINGVQVASGIAVPAKGEVVGLHLRLVSGTLYVDFYKGASIVSTQSITAGSWYFGVSLASTTAGGLSCAVNAGQWPALTAAARAGWQPVATAIDAIRLSDVDWLAPATDAEPHVRFEGLMSDAGIELQADVSFWPFADGQTRQSAVAQIRVADQNGLLSDLALQPVGDLPVDIRTIAAGEGWDDGASVARFELDGVELLSDLDTAIRLRDPHPLLDEPVNRAVFLPYVPTLAWQPQPLVLGACASVPVLPANSDGSIGFLADAPIGYVWSVMDRGDPLESGDYALTSGNQLFFDSPPLGPVVADVSSIGPSGMTPATLEHALHNLFSRVGFGAWVAADAQAIDTATGYAGIGLYIGGQQTSVRAAVARVLSSYCAWYWQDAQGRIRIARLVAPEDATSTATLDPADLAADLLVTFDAAPFLTKRAGYRPNAAQLGASDFVTDLVDVPHSRRIELAGTHRGTVYSSVQLAERYAAAERRAPAPFLFWDQDDAQAELDRVCALYATERRFFRWSVSGSTDAPLTPGQVVSISYDRYGLSAGLQVMVISARWNPVTGDAAYILWG